MRLSLKTFGCRANSVDSDALWAEAIRRGFEIVPDGEIADAYVINSCTVTADADKVARAEARKCKRSNPDAVVAVIGCYAQVAKDALLSMGEVDVVLGTADKQRVLDLLGCPSTFRKPSAGPVDESGPPIARMGSDHVTPASGYLPETFRGSRRARAAIKIQDGCNFKCSFCIIPTARGRSRSLSAEVVLRQIEDAHAAGFEEVVLTGIHLAHYGWDHGTDLVALLREALRPARGPRIRLTSLDPFEIPDDLVTMLGNEERLCPYLHIALQSGSDRVLRAMRRFYTGREFVDVTSRIFRARPDVFLGVDVIAGFPGETESEFEETLRVLDSSVWARLHVFPFSARRDTVAAHLPGAVPRVTIDARVCELRRRSDAQYARFLASERGKLRQVLLERAIASRPGIWHGRTENFLPTLTRAPGARRGTVVPARIAHREGERVWTMAPA